MKVVSLTCCSLAFGCFVIFMTCSTAVPAGCVLRDRVALSSRSLHAVKSQKPSSCDAVHVFYNCSVTAANGRTCVLMLDLSSERQAKE